MTIRTRGREILAALGAAAVEEAPTALGLIGVGALMRGAYLGAIAVAAAITWARLEDKR